MESKGRRSLRASGLIEAGGGPVKPVEAPTAEVRASEVEPPVPAELMAETTKAAETAVDLVPAVAPPASAAAPPPGLGTADDDNLGHSAAAALAESQAALARGFEALSAEMAGLALSGMNSLAHTATKLLGVKTLSDAIEVNAGFTCSSFDTLVGGSAKLSELGVRLASEASRPLLTHFRKGWKAAGRVGS